MALHDGDVKISFFPISKFIVRKSCGKPDHDHERCFLELFLLSAICEAKESLRNF